MNYQYKHFGPSMSFLEGERNDKRRATIRLMELLMALGLHEVAWRFMETEVTTHNPRFHQCRIDGKWRKTIY